MGLPFIQLESDFIKRKAVTIAAKLKIPRQLVVGMASDLIDWVVEETATDTTPPDGIILDPDAPDIIEGVMEWKGEPGKAFAAFVAAGVIEKLEVGARVRGADRYAAAWTNARVRSEKARAAAQARWGQCSSNAQASAEHCSDDAPECQDGDGDVDEYEIKKKPPPTPSTPLAQVVVVDYQTTDVGGLLITRQRQAYRFQESREGVWQFIQLARENHGLKRERTRPKRFQLWADEVLELGPDFIEEVVLDYLVDDTIKARGHPTAVLVSEGIWDARKPARAEAAHG